MITLIAHYDGKVIVPDEPVSLQPNQKLRIRIEMIDADVTNTAETPGKVDLSKLLGMGLNGPTNPNPRFPDEDSLWEGTADRNFSHWLGMGLPLPPDHTPRFDNNDQLWEKDK